MIATISNLMDFTVLSPPLLLIAFTMRKMYRVFRYIFIYKLVNHLRWLPIVSNLRNIVDLG